MHRPEITRALEAEGPVPVVCWVEIFCPRLVALTGFAAGIMGAARRFKRSLLTACFICRDNCMRVMTAKQLSHRWRPVVNCNRGAYDCVHILKDPEYNWSCTIPASFSWRFKVQMLEAANIFEPAQLQPQRHKVNVQHPWAMMAAILTTVNKIHSQNGVTVKETRARRPGQPSTQIPPIPIPPLSIPYP